MKRILFDTNVVLDVLVDWQSYAEASAAAWAAVEAGIAEGMLVRARGNDHLIPGVSFWERRLPGVITAPTERELNFRVARYPSGIHFVARGVAGYRSADERR